MADSASLISGTFLGGQAVAAKAIITSGTTNNFHLAICYLLEFRGVTNRTHSALFVAQ